ncbi:hypothetical protein KUCAC02_026974 [Chaenocephalus aceratus]|nr:hypothetical protein KUCAC02_026974 [Chaenocephalus aceratus]
MEKSQWDLKHIRISRSLTRTDDFVVQYQENHRAMLKEYADSRRLSKRKTFRVLVEKWKERKPKKKGRYVTAIRKPFPFKSLAKKVNFDNCQAIVSFVNINNAHWKLLYIHAVISTVVLVDPAGSSTEDADSISAAEKTGYLLIKFYRT